MRTVDVKADVYDWTIKVVISSDVPKLIRYFSTKCGMGDITKDMFLSRGRFFYKKHSMFWKTAFIWVPRIGNTPKDISVMSHELLHATGYILDWAGVKYSYDNDEPFTYLLDHLTRQFWTKIRKK